MYEQVLGVEIDISKVVKITKLRHDIVHRNGRSVDDRTISVSCQNFTQAISDIKKFTGALQRALNDNQTA